MCSATGLCFYDYDYDYVVISMVVIGLNSHDRCVITRILNSHCDRRSSSETKCFGVPQEVINIHVVSFNTRSKPRVSLQGPDIVRLVCLAHPPADSRETFVIIIIIIIMKSYTGYIKTIQKLKS